MRVLVYFCLVLLNRLTGHGGYAKRLHLRIVVPDVINRHVHTRTVLLHLHVPVPKKPPPPPRKQHEHEYHANWSSWRYGKYHDYEHDGEPELDHEDYHMDQKEKPRHRQKYFPVADYHKGPPSYDEDNNVEQKEHDSYAVHEDVNDVPPNTETMSYNYEEGYRKGLETESGHLKADRTHKFHEDLREEEGDVEDGGFKEDFRTKTDAGRYIVDDREYENTRDKREREI